MIDETNTNIINQNKQTTNSNIINELNTNNKC